MSAMTGANKKLRYKIVRQNLTSFCFVLRCKWNKVLGFGSVWEPFVLLQQTRRVLFLVSLMISH